MSFATISIRSIRFYISRGNKLCPGCVLSPGCWQSPGRIRGRLKWAAVLFLWPSGPNLSCDTSFRRSAPSAIRQFARDLQLPTVKLYTPSRLLQSRPSRSRPFLSPRITRAGGPGPLTCSAHPKLLWNCRGARPRTNDAVSGGLALASCHGAWVPPNIFKRQKIFLCKRHVLKGCLFSSSASGENNVLGKRLKDVTSYHKARFVILQHFI